MVFVPEGDPVKIKTLCCPGDNAPSFVLNVCVVTDHEIVPMPLVKRSVLFQFVLVIVPHVPDFSPLRISSIPLLSAYVLGIYFPM